jgi:hypothetical protein
MGPMSVVVRWAQLFPRIWRWMQLHTKPHLRMRGGSQSTGWMQRQGKRRVGGWQDAGRANWMTC